MRRKFHAALAVFPIAIALSLTSCTGKKTKTEDAPATKTESSAPAEPEVDYRSGATVIEEEALPEPEGTGGTEVRVSSGSVRALGSIINSEKAEGCDAMKTDSDKSACRDLVYFKNGTEDHNSAVCEKISDARKKQVCLMRVDKYFLDFGTCGQIKNPDTKKQCEEKSKTTDERMVDSTRESFEKAQRELERAANAGSPKERVELACSKLSGKNRDYCFDTKVQEEIAKGADASLCSVIPTPATRSACEQKASATDNKAILDQAIATKDPSKCDKLSGQQDKDLCKKIVAGGK